MNARSRPILRHLQRGLAAVSSALLLNVALLPGCAEDPKPEAFGYYVVTDGKILEIQPAENVGRAGDMGRAIYGLRGRPSLEIEDPEAYFIVYRQNAESLINSLELASLQYEFERDYEGLMSRRRLKLDMYTHQEQLPFDVVPFENDDRMFKLVPEAPLTPGPYALHTGDLRTRGMGMEQPEVFAFRVRDPRELPPPPPMAQWTEYRMLVLGAGESDVRGDDLAITGNDIAFGAALGSDLVLVFWKRSEDDSADLARILEGFQPSVTDWKILEERSVTIPESQDIPATGAFVTFDWSERLGDEALADAAQIVASTSGVPAWAMSMGEGGQEFAFVVQSDPEAFAEALANHPDGRRLEVRAMYSWRKL